MAIRKKTKKKKIQTKAADRSRGYWILVLNPDEWTRTHYHPQVIFDVLWEKGYWGLKGKSSSAKAIREGDVVVLYIAAPYRAFAGCAVVTQLHKRFSTTPRRNFDSRYRPMPQDGIKFKGLARFDTQVPITLLLNRLRCTKMCMPRWGMAVHRAVRGIARQDFVTIVKAAGALNNNLSAKMKKIIRDADQSIRDSR